MIINTERLSLRPLQIGDYIEVHEYATDNTNCQYMMFLPFESSEETLEFLRCSQENWNKDNPEFYDFAVVLSNVVIGHVSIYFFTENSSEVAELGWVFNSKYHGKGYATEAVKALKDFAVSNLGFKKISAHCDYRNAASFRLMEKIGMKLVDDTKTRLNRGDSIETKELMFLLDISTNY